MYNPAPNNKIFYDYLPGVATYYASASIGLTLEKDGTIYDVVPGTPAYDAGLGPSMKVVAVDGHPYSPEVLTGSIAHPPNGKVSLIVSNFDTVQTREILYAGGVRNPHLEPIPGRHDYLSEILASRAPAKHQDLSGGDACCQPG